MELTEQSDVVEGKTALCYEVLQHLGDCYIAVDNYGQAGKCYEKAASLCPDLPQPYVGLGLTALGNNKLDDAEIAFRVARRLDGNCAKAYAGLAAVAHQRADYKLAFRMYLKCLELDTNNLAALLGLFQTSCRMGSFEQVIYFLRVYLRMHPGDTSVMFCLATLYIKQDDLQQSQRLLKDILVLDAANRDAADLLEEVEHNLAQGLESRQGRFCGAGNDNAKEF
ncbi:MAG TPA: tetratricopeptide repeat protein [Sedimentisphaerales bacterium]|nr:tetratricopeptide repeat protein [Sedimentisphaerales bacterium]